ncbi:MAG: hypothetical protein IPL87_05025 [Candidatus Moraniibacteriota bacterium]|nr:MAG: hypothetical protein IPL87_05025 [Candidatus Moranbacteria bacterium]
MILLRTLSDTRSLTRNVRSAKSLSFAFAALSFLWIGATPTFASEMFKDNVFLVRIQTAGKTANEDRIEIRNENDCALDLSDWKPGNEQRVEVSHQSRQSPMGQSFRAAHRSSGQTATKD